MTIMSKELSDVPSGRENVKALPVVSGTDLGNEAIVKSVKLYSKTGSTYHDIDYLKSDKPFVIARFIFECGHKLNAKALTISTALHFLHKFNKF